MSTVFTGAKAIIRLDNFPLAAVSSITITHENRLEEIPQLDDLLVAEYAENGHRCSFVINSFKVNGNTAADLGLDPLNIKDLLLVPELIVEVLDGTNPNAPPVYTMSGVKFRGGSGSLDARGVWLGSWNFVARRGRGI
jgi:hypothetical protein